MREKRRGGGVYHEIRLKSLSDDVIVAFVFRATFQKEIILKLGGGGKSFLSIRGKFRDCVHLNSNNLSVEEVGTSTGNSLMPPGLSKLQL